MDREADSRALHLRPIRRIVIPTKQELDVKPVEDQPLPKNNEDDEAMSQIEVRSIIWLLDVEASVDL